MSGFMRYCSATRFQYASLLAMVCGDPSGGFMDASALANDVLSLAALPVVAELAVSAHAASGAVTSVAALNSAASFTNVRRVVMNRAYDRFAVGAIGGVHAVSR